MIKNCSILKSCNYSHYWRYNYLFRPGFGNSFGVYVYNGDPYVIGPLSTGHIVVTKTYDGSPEHMSGT